MLKAGDCALCAGRAEGVWDACCFVCWRPLRVSSVLLEVLEVMRHVLLCMLSSCGEWALFAGSVGLHWRWCAI